MSKRMLIDASHPEETRVVILSGNRVEEFDFESASRRPLKGNIFLAKVTRVEPSLQAAFVEYGGNRHGFLAFSEIHPDYYQIPVADRQALLAAQRAEERRQNDDDDDKPEAAGATPPADSADGAEDPLPTLAAAAEDDAALAAGFEADAAEAAPHGAPAAAEAPNDAPAADVADEDDAAEGDEDSQIEVVAAEPVEAEIVSSGEDDTIEEEEVEQRRRSPRMRQYKIQEVIKKRQILLIQVVKEERGNKGAALTTYLSLAGRYCVLMPNSGRGGGISRKITNSSDRRRLKDAAESLDVPEGMGLIVRTAGASRTKQEIQRDYEYLLRLWDSIRDLTLRSSAPALVYEEGNLIKRAIRDQFSKDIEEIVVEGDEGYEEASAFTKMIMPQQIDAVKKYEGGQSLFQRYKVENQLDSMFNPRVQLKSGGYIIINQTEALVAIDVNSGRSTRESNIEDTAHKTNLEAAEEIARQLRLRDLAGLIVIDFIDMEENRNDRAVERRLKDCLRHDRARIQLGRISPFGLLEMSRQRLRPGMVEGSTTACPHCNGTGLIRSVESLALRALRQVEEEAQGGRSDGVTVRVPTEVAVYILNHKRGDIGAMEERLGVSIFVEAKADMYGADCEVENGAPGGFRSRRVGQTNAVSAETALAMMPEPELETPDEEEASGDAGNIEDVETREPRESRERDGRGRRRRGGRGRDRDDRERRAARPAESGEAEAQTATEGEPAAQDAAPDAEGDAPGNEGGDRRRRRRGRRGGRRNGRPEGGQAEGQEATGEADGGDSDTVDSQAGQPEAAPREQAAAPAPKRDKSSATAAIARFFGFGARAENAEARPEPKGEAKTVAPETAVAAVVVQAEEAASRPEPARTPQAAAPKPEPEPLPVPPPAPRPEPAPEVQPEPLPEVQPEPTPQPPKHTPDPVVAHDPAPQPETPPPANDPEPAPEPEAVRAAAAAPPAAIDPVPAAAETATPETPAEPAAPAEPAPRVLIVPEVEKSDVIVVGASESGPAKAGWWKKREG